MILNDLIELLEKEDEVTVLELLNLSAADVVERFVDIIEQRQDYLRAYFGKDVDAD